MVVIIVNAKIVIINMVVRQKQILRGELLSKIPRKVFMSIKDVLLESHNPEYIFSLKKLCLIHAL
jgi:hypothetical protein